jgi:hypothetical protein
MSTWKLTNGAHANWYRAACLDYCLAHDIETNFMGFALDPAPGFFRVALLSSSSNIGPTSRLFSGVTGVLGSIAVNADASAWSAFAATSGAHWEVLYQVDGNPGFGEVAAYRLLESSADVTVADFDFGPYPYESWEEHRPFDEAFRAIIYDSNIVRGLTPNWGFCFPFSNEPLADDVAYGATGTGSIVTVGSTTATTSGSHTIAAGDNLVIADVGAMIFAASGTVTLSDFTVTYGGAPMTPVAASVTVGTLTQKVKVGQFYLLDPPSEPQTTTVDVTLSRSPTESSSSLFINTVSYSGAGAPKGPDFEGGTSATANSDTVGTVAAGEMAHWVHANGINSTAFSAYNQTQRATGGPVGAGRYLIGDAVGAGAGITSTATQASNDRWIACGCIIPKT